MKKQLEKYINILQNAPKWTEINKVCNFELLKKKKKKRIYVKLEKWHLYL